MEADLIEAVVLLPENLFYNTTAPGIVVVLNRHKNSGRKGQFLLINASEFFVKKKPKNELTEEGIAAASEVFHKWVSREKLSQVVTLEQVRDADFNLSPSLFVETNEKKDYRPLGLILSDLRAAKFVRTEADEQLHALLKMLGLES